MQSDFTGNTKRHPKNMQKRNIIEKKLCEIHNSLVLRRAQQGMTVEHSVKSELAVHC